MTLSDVAGGVPPELASALARFEAGFTYPLGPGRTFRITHGSDYAGFYRAQGHACVLALSDQDEVIGVIAASLRRLAGCAGEALYLGDLKLAPRARGGVALLRLLRGIQGWIGARTTTGYAVVMDGTAVTPERYTGRLGVPAFRPVFPLIVLRLPCRSGPANAAWSSVQAEALDCFAQLAVGSVHPLDEADRARRSRNAPQWLRDPDGNACGVLEDTMLAKRLFDDAGAELLSAHLGRFAWRHPRAGAACLAEACSRAAALGFDAVFCAVPDGRAAALLDACAGDGITVAPAMVYACGLPTTATWIIDTAEI